jgi:hypothetical protein
METKLRELRMKSLKAKIAACQEECSKLAVKSSAPYSTPEEKATIERLQRHTITHCQNLRHMLSLYDDQGGGEKQPGLRN